MLTRLLARIPLWLLHALGALLGWATLAGSPTYRSNLRANLARAGYRDFGSLARAAASAGRMMTELPAIWWRPRERALELIRSCEGLALLEAAIAARRGIVVLTPHLGCFEIVGQFVAARFPITCLYRPPRFAFLQPLLERGREQPNLRLAPADLSGVREIVAALRRGESVGILPDQVPGAGEGEWAEFFGAPAFSMTLAAKLAQRPGVACLFMVAERLPWGRGYALRVSALPPALPGESAVRRINRAVEELVRRCPGQFLWGYNRYKAPAGAPPVAPPAAG